MTTVMFGVKLRDVEITRPVRPHRSTTAGEPLMKVTREQVAENRQKILEAASRLFRDRGYDGVTVAEVMGAAGLTHGGFYGHFASKDELIAETLAVALARSAHSDADVQ